MEKLLLQPMALVFGSFQGKSDRSIGCCGEGALPAQWSVGPHAQQRGADIYADLKLVTSRGAEEVTTNLHSLRKSCLNAVPARNFIDITCLVSGLPLNSPTDNKSVFL